MNDLNPEWMLELEESAEGESVFRPLGEQLQIEQARDQAEAAVSTLARAETGATSQRGWQKARTHRTELQAAMERLEATVAKPAAPHHRWADAVEASLMALEDALRAHIREVEGIDGLLAEIVDMAPRLVAEVETIKKEHVDLVGSWSRARQALRGDDKASVTQVRRRVIALLGRLAIHRQRGSDLVYEAYNVDITAAD